MNRAAAQRSSGEGEMGFGRFSLSKDPQNLLHFFPQLGEGELPIVRRCLVPHVESHNKPKAELERPCRDTLCLLTLTVSCEITEVLLAQRLSMPHLLRQIVLPAIVLLHCPLLEWPYMPQVGGHLESLNLCLSQLCCQSSNLPFKISNSFLECFFCHRANSGSAQVNLGNHSFT